jgi:hypothetical protein
LELSHLLIRSLVMMREEPCAAPTFFLSRRLPMLEISRKASGAADPAIVRSTIHRFDTTWKGGGRLQACGIRSTSLS